MNMQNHWTRAQASVAHRLTDFCVARDAHRGTAWERLSVAYPDPIEALRAIELSRRMRLRLTAATA